MSDFVMLPPFDIEGGPWLALARGLAVAGLFSVAGSLLARVAVLPPVLGRLAPGDAQTLEKRWRRLLAAGFVVAALALAAWAWLVAATFADPPGFTGTASTLAIVLRETAFGHVVLLQLLALALAALAAARRGHWVAAGLAVAAVALEAGHSHAAAMQGGFGPLVLSVGLHLLAGATWLGGLAPLLLIFATAPPAVCLPACGRFTAVGWVCVVVLASTAGYQFWNLIGTVPGLIGSAYGLMALIKLVLFASLLGFAARNHFVFAPDLAGQTGRAARRRLQRSIAGETAAGLLVVLAAGLLSCLPPAMHVQPLWPFALRPSLVTIQEDPDFRREVILAALALGGAVLLLAAAALVRRRARWLGVAAAAIIIWFAAPHLRLLLVEAYPTSYDHSPTGFTASSIVTGQALYPQHCASCHGASGRGDGPAAAALPVPPADLTAAHLWMHSDGELIWWLSHGMAAPDGSAAMPGFAAALSEDERWDLIDYIRARNAGLATRNVGTWPVPLRAPGFEAKCAGDRSISLTDLRGHEVLLLIGAHVVAPKLPAGVTAIEADPTQPLQPNDDVCVATDEDIAGAYAVASGLPAAGVQNAQFLIDGQGWLRTLWRPAAQAGLNDPAGLAAAVAAVRAHPVAMRGSEQAAMKM